MLARTGGNTHNIAELRARMGNETIALAQRRQAEHKLHELGLISDDHFDRYRARSAIDSLLGGAGVIGLAA